MKPLVLKMSAFGPYAKPTTLNFKDDLDQQDIFVVTGPTGAGKTTIFDAICYALYGETSGGSRSGKELRSDFVKESEIKTEVSFTFSVKDKTYCVTRAPQQLQKKKRGEGFREVPATVEFLELNSDYPPLTKDSEVREQIQQIIGLKIEQFRKIVMIPQGDFKEFLVANTTNKEEILRKIFGTDFYKAVQEQLTVKANLLKTDVLETQQKIEAELQLVKTDKETALDITQPLENVFEQVNQQQQLFMAYKEKLDGLHKELLQKINAYQQEYEEKKRLNEKIEEYELAKTRLEHLKGQQETVQAYEKQINQAKHAQTLLPLENECLRYQALKQDTLVKQTQLKEELMSCETEFILVKKCYDAIDSLRQELDEMNRVREELSRYVESVKRLGEKKQLLRELRQEGIELGERVKNWNDQLKELKHQVGDLDRLTEEKGLCKEQQHAQEVRELKMNEDVQYVTLLCQKLETYGQTRSSLIGKEDKVREVLEAAKVKRENYEHQAQLFMNAAAIRLANELKVGQPCPVCGSCEHPNPSRSEEVILSKAELEKFRLEVESLEQRGRSEENEVSILRVTLKKIEEELNDLKTLLFQRSLIAESEEITDVDAAQLKLQLVNQQSELLHKKKQLMLTLTKLEQEMKQLMEKKAMISPLEEKLSKGEKELQGQREAYQSELRSIKDLEEGIPQDYRSAEVLMIRLKELSTNIEAIEKNIKTSQEDYQRVSSQITRLTTLNEEVTKQLSDYTKEFETSQSIFLGEVAEKFADKLDYEQAKTWIEQMQVLEQHVTRYYQEWHTAITIEQTLRRELKDETKVDLTRLEDMMDHLSQERLEIEKQRATIQANHEQNEHILSSVTKKYHLIQAKEKDYAILGELDSLANGRSGRRMSFETYVLSSYFDEVLLAANLRLQKMTARRYYLLRREEVKGGGRKGLDLDVYDSHTCNQRPVNTLSGGESFKASLALALGLCDVVQQNSGGIQLDTMFIDEGFGTLDAESLDQAIDILMDLQDHGRLIGIISHVNELKERIPVKLMVETDATGSRAYFRK